MAIASAARSTGRLAPLAVAVGILATSAPAGAITIELKDAAPDRVERQRAHAAGRLPLPGTPDLSRFEARRKELGLAAGTSVLVRIFKSEMQLELWARRGDEYVLFSTYPLCHWSGTLGPKIKEGDRQTPEGFYTVAMRQLHRIGRWPRSLNLGFPNVFDRAHSRSGSYILLHGGCSSTGCFAVTNGVIAEVYTLVSEALRGGQRHVPVHVFPFRMTRENLASHATSEWSPFWQDLAEASRSFERTRVPPKISVCNGRYRVEDATSAEVTVPLPAEENSKKRRSALRSAERNAGAILNSCPAELATDAAGPGSGVPALSSSPEDPPAAQRGDVAGRATIPAHNIP